MPKRIDLVGKKIGRLSILSAAPGKRYGKLQASFVCWNCRCDCGNTTIVSSCSLRMGTKSCGCLKIEAATKTCIGRSIEPEEAIINLLFGSYEAGAKKRNMTFALSREDFVDLLKQNCFYCDEQPKNNYTKKYKHKQFIFKYTGIDRVDNTKGYTIDNVLPCCKDCNYSKNKRSKEEFLLHIKKIYERHFT
jgi:hypothetical protein